jgi:hypothetical protein
MKTSTQRMAYLFTVASEKIYSGNKTVIDALGRKMFC